MIKNIEPGELKDAKRIFKKCNIKKMDKKRILKIKNICVFKRKLKEFINGRNLILNAIDQNDINLAVLLIRNGAYI